MFINVLALFIDIGKLKKAYEYAKLAISGALKSNTSKLIISIYTIANNSVGINQYKMKIGNQHNSVGSSLINKRLKILRL